MSRQKGNPKSVLIVTIMLFLLNLIGFVSCRTEHQRYAKLQAQIESLPQSTPDDDAIPETNRPRGQLSGVTGWAAFYGDLEKALAKVLWVSAFFVLFGVIWARAPRTG